MARTSYGRRAKNGPELAFIMNACKYDLSVVKVGWYLERRFYTVEGCGDAAAPR
jgi:hypothetical protein